MKALLDLLHTMYSFIFEQCLVYLYAWLSLIITILPEWGIHHLQRICLYSYLCASTLVQKRLASGCSAHWIFPCYSSLESLPGGVVYGCVHPGSIHPSIFSSLRCIMILSMNQVQVFSTPTDQWCELSENKPKPRCRAWGSVLTIPVACVLWTCLSLIPNGAFPLYDGLRLHPYTLTQVLKLGEGLWFFFIVKANISFLPFLNFFVI